MSGQLDNINNSNGLLNFQTNNNNSESNSTNNNNVPERRELDLSRLPSKEDAMAEMEGASTGHDGRTVRVVSGRGYRYVTPFPYKLHEMLDEVEKAGGAYIVSWLPCGKAFKVHEADQFLKKIVPLYFKQRQYKSFQRQLHLYGFQRISKGADKGAYYNKHFIRGDRSLCHKMNRKMNKAEHAIHEATKAKRRLMEQKVQPALQPVPKPPPQEIAPAAPTVPVEAQIPTTDAIPTCEDPSGVPDMFDLIMYGEAGAPAARSSTMPPSSPPAEMQPETCTQPPSPTANKSLEASLNSTGLGLDDTNFAFTNPFDDRFGTSAHQKIVPNTLPPVLSSRNIPSPVPVSVPSGAINGFNGTMDWLSAQGVSNFPEPGSTSPRPPSESSDSVAEHAAEIIALFGGDENVAHTSEPSSSLNDVRPSSVTFGQQTHQLSLDEPDSDLWAASLRTNTSGLSFQDPELAQMFQI